MFPMTVLIILFSNKVSHDDARSESKTLMAGYHYTEIVESFYLD